jgi:hypothetical protein
VPTTRRSATAKDVGAYLKRRNDSRATGRERPDEEDAELPQSEHSQYSKLVKMVIEDLDQQLQARDLRGYNPLRDDDAPASNSR